MFSFFKKKKPKPTVPNWAPYFNLEQYEAFMNEVVTYFDALDREYVISGGVVRFKEESNNQLGLQNVGQMCSASPLSDYAKNINGHFNGIFNAEKFSKEFDLKKHDYNYAKEYLGARLYPKSFQDVIKDKNSCSRDFVGDMVTLAVYDFPDTVQTLSTGDSDLWSVDKYQVIQDGIDNMERKYPLVPEQKDAFGLKFWSVETPHFFAANIVYHIKRYPEIMGSKGLLMIMPTRSLVIMYPIESIEVIQAINQMIPLAHNIFNDGPGSLSNNLIWYHNDVFSNQPYEFGEDNKLAFKPTVAFVEMMNGLMPDNKEN